MFTSTLVKLLALSVAACGVSAAPSGSQGGMVRRAETPANKIVDAFTAFTASARSTTTAVEALTIVTAIQKATTIPVRIQDLYQLINAEDQRIQSAGVKLVASGETLISDAISAFTPAQIDLLDAILEKRTIILEPFQAPIKAALRALEATFDNFNATLIPLLTAVEASTSQKLNEVSFKIRLVIEAYENPLPVKA